MIGGSDIASFEWLILVLQLAKEKKRLQDNNKI